MSGAAEINPEQIQSHQTPTVDDRATVGESSYGRHISDRHYPVRKLERLVDLFQRILVRNHFRHWDSVLHPNQELQCRLDDPWIVVNRAQPLFYNSQ